MLEAVGYKICLKPNKTQKLLLNKYANHSRGLYNILLAEAKRAYQEESLPVNFRNLYHFYQTIKQSDEYAWLLELPEACGKQVCKDLIDNYYRVFKSGFGFLKFKKKGKSKLSFYQRTDKLKFWNDNSRVTINGVGRIKCNKGNYPQSGFCNPRVTFDGKFWYLSFGIRGSFSVPCDSYSDGIGIDVGIKEFAVVSTGDVIENYNNATDFIKLQNRLKTLQQVLSKKYELNKKGNVYVKTGKIRKLEKKIRLLQRHITYKKLNAIHNATSSLVRTKPEFIAVEHLDIKAMKEAPNNFSKSIQQVAWYEFFRQLQYKAEFQETKFVRVGQYFPSTKRCSCCDSIKDNITIQDREYVCDICGFRLDRDLNAAINIREEGRRLLVS